MSKFQIINYQTFICYTQMKASLKEQFMRLKKQKEQQMKISQFYQKDKQTEKIGKKQEKPKYYPEIQEKKQAKNLFKNMMFCFPHYDIELTKKQAHGISKQIIAQGGTVLEYGDHLYFQPIDFVLISPTKARVQTVKKRIQGKLNYLDILDYNYVQCCIADGTLIQSQKFSLNTQDQQKRQINKLQPSFSGKKKRKMDESQEDDKQKEQKLSKRSLTEQIPPSQQLESDPQQRNFKKLDKDKFFCQKGKQQDKPAINKFIQNELLQLQKIYANQRDIGRKIAYGKAASLVRTWKEEIKTEDDVDKIPGIGPKIRIKIKEIVTTGKLKKLDELNQSEQVVAMGQLSKVWGVGPAKAKELYQQGIKSIEQLRKNQTSLTKNQKIGLKYYEDFQIRIPRQKVTKMFQVVRNTLKTLTKIPEAYTSQVCGSYRRGKASCGDMDIIITRKDGVFEKDLLIKLVAELKKIKFLTDNLSEPKCNEGHVSTSYMGVCKFEDQTHHRIDIKHYPLEEYAFAILYFTGSGMFNRSMRLYANKLGLQLSDKGFARRPQKNGVSWKKNIPLCYKEEDVFNVLGLDYKTPQQRDD